MPSSSHSTTEKEVAQDIERYDPNVDDQDAEFGGPEARKALEKKLLLKVDLRMSILVFIYILNYVRVILHAASKFNSAPNEFVTIDRPE